MLDEGLKKGLSGNNALTDFFSLVEVDRFQQIYSRDINEDGYFGMPLDAIVNTEKRLRSKDCRCVAYFSMEYGLASSFYNKFKTSRQTDSKNMVQEHEVFSNFRLADYFFTLKSDSIIDLPIYSGGLGVLAGDTIKTMADYKLPAVAIGMLWNSGYFKQKFWFKYGQAPEAMQWDLFSYPGLIPLKNKIKISLKSGELYLRLWKYYVYSWRHDYAIPLVLLDSNVEENSEENRHLTDQLYKSDNPWIKIMQRVILGMGGVAAIRELAYNIDLFHLNEGHAVFAFVEKARDLPADAREDISRLKEHFVYTCHTPVEAGHDRFVPEDLFKVINKEDFSLLEKYGKDSSGMINLTLMSMNVSSITNAVSLNHEKVMHIQFPRYADMITHVTNGVHPNTWMSGRILKMCERFSSYLGDIRDNPMALDKVRGLKGSSDFRQELWNAHQSNKKELCDYLGKWDLSVDNLTVCWARRIAAYKRPSMLLQDISRLIDMAKKYGPIQIIYAGKAHPKDNIGFTYINEMMDKVDKLTDVYDYVKVLFLENYDINLARMLTCGVDVWLNNPLPPFEASGTSGMKAILNGVIQISTLDGWVVEAADLGIGRIFGYANPEGQVGSERDLRITEDSLELYSAIEEIAGLYYKTNKKGNVDIYSRWVDMMIDCIATGSRFNTYRMLDEYKDLIWKVQESHA